MTDSLSFVVGDTAPSVFGTLTIGGAVVDLTNVDSVRFQMRELIDSRLSVDAEAVIVTAATGSVRYDWATGDLSRAGSFESRWDILWNDGQVQHSDPGSNITVSPI